ncbi:hypothetical protein BCV69DRAFT_315230 [Microstroma glucosiphilum]|uniref:SnoaL-like domain-containing protein n=1 Tax=Pseudomicrostroma glucosiphilum TaxID=1684307 RepID=A0A316TXD5_9BASI|nr:hypothetical protein BCV69DRAFT_315230 [Pseudomicrostroma glucosiphilum]PWN17840.1 hypothetical protein BCV69DRAFT_315230 [Pseudomicrostroma glucosiphilum]
MTTIVKHSSTLPPSLSSFIKKVYELSDIESAHEEYCTLFTSPTHLQIGPMKPVTTHEEILQIRKDSWEQFNKRRHVVEEVYVHPDAAPGSEQKIMLHGSVELSFKDESKGSTRASWAALMVLEGIDGGQEPKVKSYVAWLTMG